MCLYPTLRPNKKFTKTKKNGGIIPAVSDERTRLVPTACGECMECRKQKAREWQVRLLEDVRENKNGKFVTLTFSDEAITKLYDELRDEDTQGYTLDNIAAKTAVRRFLERWRKEHKKSVRHWLITELGHNGTENIHLHGIIWTDKENSEIEKHWNYGMVWIGDYVSERTVNYIIKYVHKQDKDHKAYKPKICTSAGIGACYMNRTDWKNNKYREGGNTRTYYTTKTGTKMAMPIYWRNKIYTDEEKEKLWIEMLNKNERYVDGEKISVTNGEDEYWKAVEDARIKSKRIGFGEPVTWEQKQYEKQLRILKQMERNKNVTREI